MDVSKKYHRIFSFLHCACMKKPLIAASCKSLKFGSPGRARSDPPVGRSPGYYRFDPVTIDLLCRPL